jgi:Ca2+-binding EF-hand superfamily protein
MLISFIILTLTQSQLSTCQQEITIKFNSFLNDLDNTPFELFDRFDSDSNKCIDYYEMNTLLQKIKVSWKCRWVQKMIDYFDVIEKDNCIQWTEFKTVLRNTRDD